MPTLHPMPSTRARRLSITACAAAVFLSACGGDGDDDATAAASPPAGIAAPTIATGPAAATVAAGQPATFSVSAGGSALSYQWRVDGVDIAGATGASYTTPPTVSSDSGKAYSVVVSNAGGSVTSSAASLTVNATASSASVSASQASAEALVAEVNDRVADVRSAGLTGGLPLGAQIVLLPTGALFTDSVPCASLAAGGTGSGSIDLTYTTDDATGAPVRGDFDFNDCRFSTSGTSTRVDGRGSVVYSNYLGPNDYTITLTYDNVGYEYMFGGVVESGTLNMVQTCTSAAGVESCTVTVGDSTLQDVSVEQDGSITTVQHATVTGTTLTIEYEGWVYDSSLHRATGGTVTVTDSAGNRAVITATGTGYTVVVTLVGGASSTWTVAFAT